MNNEEKWFCLQAVLLDLRGDWSHRQAIRVATAHKLAMDLDYQPTVLLCDEYDYEDGRHFRCSVDFGGYEGMEAKHGLPWTFLDKSEEVKDFIKTYTHYSTFEDNDKNTNINKFGQWL